MTRGLNLIQIFLLILLAEAAAIFLGMAAAYAGERFGVLIYAETGGAKYTARELYLHELGHLNCPTWSHPDELKPNGKLYMPPKQCLTGKPPFPVEVSKVSRDEAFARCEGLTGKPATGCSAIFEE